MYKQLKKAQMSGHVKTSQGPKNTPNKTAEGYPVTMYLTCLTCPIKMPFKWWLIPLKDWETHMVMQ